MTPEEKAKELLNKFGSYAHSTHIAKAAAICVKEIISSWNEDGHKRLDAPVIAYWQQVLNHINSKP
jgi:hypothetical protein